MSILDYAFANPALRAQALTHPSAGGAHYQRLEFLGDRVLGLVVAEMLYEALPDAPEGVLGQRHAVLVSAATLVKIGRHWALEPHVRVGKGEQQAPLNGNILADVVEALLGAVYLDGGMGAVRALMEPAWAPLLREHASDEKDPKTRLQELLQAQGHPLPTYDLMAEEGPAHARAFSVRLVCALGEAAGQGSTKQAAQAAAAAELLAKL
jgi:ribonuclease-3